MTARVLAAFSLLAAGIELNARIVWYQLQHFQDQEFFAEKGFQPPWRCKECSRAKKEQRGDGERKGGRG